jgi:hypothetical protein
MRPSVGPRRRRSIRRGRASVLTAAAAFALLQLGLALALIVSWPLRDPEYGPRLESLRARLAERAPGRPLVIFLGSSRTAWALRPGLLATNRDRPGRGPVVFNFGLCGAGPPMELMCLRRLLADGVRPSLVFIEVSPETMPWQPAQVRADGPAPPGLGGWSATLPVRRLNWADVTTLGPLYEDAPTLRRCWLRDNLVPWYWQRAALMEAWSPGALPPDRRWTYQFQGLDEWGWQANPAMGVTPDPGARSALLADHRRRQNALAESLAVSAVARQALAAIASVCRNEGIATGAILPPDPLLGEYSPVAEANLCEQFGRLSAELDLPMVDARAWARPADSPDGVHLSHQGAAAFTRRLEGELQPYFEGRPLAERWPPGRREALPSRPREQAPGVTPASG